MELERTFLRSALQQLWIQLTNHVHPLHRDYYEINSNRGDLNNIRTM